MELFKEAEKKQMWSSFIYTFLHFIHFIVLFKRPVQKRHGKETSKFDILKLIKRVLSDKKRHKLHPP